MASTASKIEYYVCIGLRGPISPGDYKVGNASVNVSYPDTIPLPTGPVQLPRGASTFFRVSWLDDGATRKLLNSRSFERHLVIHSVLASISELLTAFKLVRVGHADGLHVRTVGIADVLMYTSVIDGKPTGDLNAAILFNYVAKPEVTTKLALEHIGSDTYPVARRYVRCFELIEAGFYKEAIIVAHAILDDIVQDLIHDLLEKKRLATKKERDNLVRAIKEDRFSIYLGPLLKTIGGVAIDEIWGDAPKAIQWFNTQRNNIAHGGSEGDREAACKAVFVSMKVVAALSSRNLIDVKFPPGMRRHSRLLAAWTLNRPSWVPDAASIETDEFD